MDRSDINFLAQLLITGFDLWFNIQTRRLELDGKTKEELIDRLKMANQILKDLPDLETE